MHPLLFSISFPYIGTVPFHSYMTFLFFGMFSALICTVWLAKRSGIDPYRIYNLNLVLMVVSLIGARLLHVIADGHFQDYVDLCLHPQKVKATQALVSHCFTYRECGFDYLCDPVRNLCYPPRDCLAFAKFWNGGLAYYGGFLLSTLVSILYCRYYGLPFWQVADLAAPAIALGLSIARVGCFLQGCCYGDTTQSIFGVSFPIGSLPWQAQLKDHIILPKNAMTPVHPTQLYESLGCLVIACLIWFVLRKRKQQPGYTLGCMMVLYGVLRIACEMFRADERGVLFGVVSTSQLISIPLIGLGCYLMYRRTKPFATLAHRGSPSD